VEGLADAAIYGATVTSVAYVPAREHASSLVEARLRHTVRQCRRSSETSRRLGRSPRRRRPGEGVVMQLELDDGQAELLRTLLDTALRDLSCEIADTDLPAFRRMLLERRTTLEQLLDLVGGPIPNEERFTT
jgi:hypothetical protein